jgi:hypothetical protein
MSSPVHHPNDLDAALRYAPPWARKTSAPDAPPPGNPAMEGMPTSPSDDDGELPFDGDWAMLTLQHRLSLDPEQIPEAPVRIDNRPTSDRIALRLCAVAGIAAFFAGLTISLPINVSLPIKISLPIKPQLDAVLHAAGTPALTATPVRVVHIHTAITPLPVASPTPVAPVAVAVHSAEATPVATEAAVVHDADVTPVAPAAVAVRSAEATLTSAPEPPEAVQATVPPQPAAKTATLAPDEIAMLVKRGKDLMMNGDISSARLLLRRAAAAGNAEAALAFGSTFDPAVITRLGAIGVQADAAKARKWYERAAALGSNFASEQIAKLAETGR